MGQSTSNRARIGVSTWSFHNLFPSTRDDNATASGKNLDMLDFPEMVADRYQVHELEFVAPHFAATSASYVQEVKRRLQQAHSHLVNIPVDIDELKLGAGLSDPDPKLRDRVIEACSKWIDIAHELGVPSVRCDPGKINSANSGRPLIRTANLQPTELSKELRSLLKTMAAWVLNTRKSWCASSRKLAANRLGLCQTSVISRIRKPVSVA
jgi:sugar phosphate isomerase/epimerase